MDVGAPQIGRRESVKPVDSARAHVPCITFSVRALGAELLALLNEIANRG